MSRHLHPGEWGNSHLGNLFGTQGHAIGRYLNGQSYPTVPMIQKFDIVLGWPAAEQFDLIPPYWTWPDQPTSTTYTATTVSEDLRYAMKLKQVLTEWCEANPRTQPLSQIRLHPKLDAKGRQGRSKGGQR